MKHEHIGIEFHLLWKAKFSSTQQPCGPRTISPRGTASLRRRTSTGNTQILYSCCQHIGSVTTDFHEEVYFCFKFCFVTFSMPLEMLPWGLYYTDIADMCARGLLQIPQTCSRAHYRYCRHVPRGSLQILQTCVPMGSLQILQTCVPRGPLQILQTCGQGFTTDTADMCSQGLTTHVPMQGFTTNMLTTDTADMCPGVHYKHAHYRYWQICAQGFTTNMLTTDTADM